MLVIPKLGFSLTLIGYNVYKKWQQDDKWERKEKDTTFLCTNLNFNLYWNGNLWNINSSRL